MSTANVNCHFYGTDKTFARDPAGDPSVNAADVKKLVFVSGKHYYTLLAKRDELKRKDVAIVRIESLCPFPAKEIQDEVARFKNVQCNILIEC